MNLDELMRGTSLQGFAALVQAGATRRRAEQGLRVPVVLALPADRLTPLGAWERLRPGAGHDPHCFLFESIEGGEHLARYSFAGFRPTAILRSWGHRVQLERRLGGERSVEDLDGDPRELLRASLHRALLVDVPGLPRFIGGAVGFFGYGSVRLVEDIPPAAEDPFDTPDLDLAFYDELIVFDHLRSLIQLVVIVELPAGQLDDLEAPWRGARRRLAELTTELRAAAPPRTRRRTPGAADVSSNFSREDFEAGVRRLKEHIRAGDIFQGVLSQRFEVPLHSPPLELYRALRVLNPSPYLFFVEMGDHTLVGASPELLVRVEQGVVETLPIAGTRPRGADREQDDRLAVELRSDPKERAEHEMLVDLGRNDLGRVAEFGTVRVTEHLELHRFSHVIHLVSRVQARMRDDKDALDALYACFPAGTVSGAPKVRAMQLLSGLEPTARGVYAGAVGYLDYRGELDTCIAIRTAVIHDGVAHVQAGAGIVYDSDPAAEYEETRNKARALLEAIRWADEGLLDASEEEPCC